MDPLAQLNDIHIPQQVHGWPVALGWWLLAATVLIAVSYFIWRYVKLKRINKIKQTALNLLVSEQHSPAELIKILKWACMHYFPRTDVANQYGDQLASFLRQALPEKKQSGLNENIGKLLDTHYRKETDHQTQEQLQQQIVYWLQHALPPKAKPKSNVGEVK
ncbi:DUF4381 domain-containing protein [Thalassotalea marina]|uniref:DUF4381 domain-containing protein n=1 Tax=Thalassotalea marina TaxID=1673741 RepID=A0A919BBR8_9GAMM|nr:DUF4381 domain-containing protein [Thalassotalea marina]GHF81141.1 hypothetical protein GCM10017161_05650 [Thalassotalea marina]